MHGDADNLVPIEDGYTYHEILSKRPGPGTNAMQVVQGMSAFKQILDYCANSVTDIMPKTGGDHNFIGRYDEVVDIIVKWLKQQNIAGKGKL